MAPFVGPSGTAMNLDPVIAGGLVRNGTIVEIADGLSSEQVAEIVAERFGEKPATVTETAAVTPAPAGDAEPPRGNASREAWVEYAITQGKTEDDLAGLKQGEIRALFDTEETAVESEGEPADGEPVQGDPAEGDPAQGEPDDADTTQD